MLTISPSLGGVVRGLDLPNISFYHARMKKDEGQRETVGIWISRPLHRRVKIEAARRGTDMRTLVEDAISKYIKGGADDTGKRTPPV